MNSRVNPGATIMNTGDYQFEAISLMPRGTCASFRGRERGRTDFCSDTTIICQCHSKNQSDTQSGETECILYSTVFSMKHSCLLQFSPLFQVESSLCLLICSLVCQAPSTSNDKHVEKCANYLYRVLILSAIQR